MDFKDLLGLCLTEKSATYPDTKAREIEFRGTYDERPRGQGAKMVPRCKSPMSCYIM